MIMKQKDEEFKTERESLTKKITTLQCQRSQHLKELKAVLRRPDVCDSESQPPYQVRTPCLLSSYHFFTVPLSL